VSDIPANVAFTTKAPVTFSAGDVWLGADPATDPDGGANLWVLLRELYLGTDLDHLADEFVPHGHLRSGRLADPVAVGVDMKIRTTYAGSEDLD
jgi:hypothetical protein